MTLLNNLFQYLFAGDNGHAKREGPMSSIRKNKFQPGVETLEDRIVPTWSSTPPAIVNLTAAGNDRTTITSFGSNGNFVRTASITRSEIDYRSFVAQRTGTYTFEARASGSRIDTVAALFASNGQRLAYNDDASPNNHNSKFTAKLTAGRTYVFGITNYKNSPNGAYQAVISAPGITNSASTGLGRIYSDGYASLKGTTLTLHLYGQTMSDFYVTDHQIEVQILNLQGKPIHSGSWVRGFRTAGALVPGAPERKSDTWTFDVSGFDLSKASQLAVRVSYF